MPNAAVLMASQSASGQTLPPGWDNLSDHRSALVHRMNKFYFHAQKNGELILDEEGAELPSVEAAKREALESARELLADAVRHGKASTVEAVVIADEAGRTIEIVPLADALPESFRRSS